MAHHIERTLKVNVSAEKIWQVLENYSGVETSPRRLNRPLSSVIYNRV